MNLKTSLLKDKKLNSEKLRTENKKMELRLQQLKLAMCKEKEERLSSGIQSNWSSGTAGALLNYKPNLSAIDTGKRLRLKMLKEESVAPVSTAPGTGGARVVNTKGSFMKSDAFGVEDGHGKGDSNRDFNGVARRGSNRHCGQCEENAAAVNCKECAEDYCPKCFAAFHLKGALRKHRSTPISTLNNRVSIPSPLFKPPDLRNISSNESNQRLSIDNLNDKKVKKQTSFVTENKEELIEYSKENFSPKYSGSSLAEGTYNEELSNQYFQEAVNAWRNNVELTEQTPIYEKHPTIEHSTETIKVNQDQRLLSDVIQFTPSLTYAEQLLLRKHRNNELAPVDMKYILNRLTKTNEQELLENQKLLQSNLVLETSLINSSTENALRNDEYHIDFECINRLINEADLIGGRQSSLTVQNVLASPFKVEELDLSCNTIKNEEEIPMQIELNQIPLYNDQVEIKNSNNTEIAIENDPPKPVRYDVKEKRSKSALNKNNNSGKPLSARRTPSRIQNGGLITSKPSVLLNILSDFSNYLPPEQVRSKNKNISDDKNEKRPASASFNKISYNFYKVTPNSWKPSQAWLNNRLEETDGQKGTNDLLYTENENIDVEIESELEKLNLLSKEDKTVTDNGLTNSRVKSSARLTIFDDNNHNLFNECDLNDCDEESEKQEVFDQLNSLERELTVISKQEEELNFSNYDDIVADSLEIGNDNTDLNSMNLDKFCLEDSLDIPQSNSNTAREYDNIDDEDNEELMMNCSSRFDDYDDVYKLN